jgi:hypothetical protein
MRHDKIHHSTKIFKDGDSEKITTKGNVSSYSKRN